MASTSITETLADRIDAILPQTQCGRCGYPACRPYAEAVAQGKADINQCPPGGTAGIRALADLLGIAPKPMNPAYEGEHAYRTVALIDEQQCIGCVLCIVACPVDAILGATKQMHTVIAHECTGCERCIAPCPVDCIAMISVTPAPREDEFRAYDPARATLARRRYLARQRRVAHDQAERAVRLRDKKAATTLRDDADKITAGKDAKKAYILAIEERLRAKRARQAEAKNVPGTSHES